MRMYSCVVRLLREIFTMFCKKKTFNPTSLTDVEREITVPSLYDVLFISGFASNKHSDCLP